MHVEETIKERLTAAFQPVSLQVVNDSHRHAGHASSPGTGESHFSVRVVAPAFAGKSRVERHRMVNDALADLLQGKVHALAIQALAPGEKR
jgi:BolA family transcriptional regulator, general stress-responsive regulator